MGVYAYLRALVLAKSGVGFESLLMGAMLTASLEQAGRLSKAFPDEAKEVSERSRDNAHYSPSFDDVREGGHV
jgi:hypothetical protein